MTNTSEETSRCFHFTDFKILIFDSIEGMIGQIDNEDKETYILGDLNCNLLNQTNLDNDAKHLLRILEIYQLTQLITKPTRIT